MWLSKAVYAARRRSLMQRLGPHAAAIIPSAPVATRSNDVEYPYRPDNDFLYLTGFREPEAVCVLAPGHPKGEFILFVRPRDRERETWTGRRAGTEGAVADYGADCAFSVMDLDREIGEYVSHCDHVYYSLGRDRAFNEKVTRWLQQWRQGRPRTGSGPIALLDPGELLHEMRLFKTDDEIDEMREAAAIAARGHQAAMESVRPGAYEYEIEALLDYTFRRHGASGPAYPSIVAGGVNATVLHYIENDQRLEENTLLLIDAGAEYHGYCSDVTRTFPVGARFTEAQRQLYELVLRAQLAGISAVRPGVPVDAPHQRAVEVLVDGLLDLGLLRGQASDIISNETFRPFYMHRTSHWLGMDVHDVGSYKVGDKVRTLEPGMVLTVEPGLYVAADAEDAPLRFRGIGIRIEDDVLVTDAGHDVLSRDIPKDADEIERIRSRNS